MTNHHKSMGFFPYGLPYVRSGKGPKPLIIFQGLTFENKPQPWMTFGYGFLKKIYTLYAVLRKIGLPQGYSLKDMADDYAHMIRQEFQAPVDVVGISTGGSIALSFAADHSDLVRRLVIHSSAHSLNETAKQLQMDVARLAQLGQWRKAWAKLIATIYPQSGLGKRLTQPLVGLSAGLLSLNAPKDASDLVVTVLAEDKFAFKNRLAEITAPTLIVGGTNDFFYSSSLFRETADGIPNTKLCLYKNMGHPAVGKQFQRDVLEFLSK